jgi:hypothetical protein
MRKNTPQSVPQESPKRTPWLLILVLVAAGLFLLQKMGIKSVNRSENASELDYGSEAYKNARLPKERTEDPSEVDAVLKDLDEEYGDVTIKAHEPSKNAGLGKDEERFYKILKAFYAADPNLQSAENWMIHLRAGRETYRAVRSAFEAVSSSDLDETNLGPFIKKPEMLAEIAAAIEVKTGIPTGSLSTFNGQAISDWALQVERSRR